MIETGVQPCHLYSHKPRKRCMLGFLVHAPMDVVKQVGITLKLNLPLYPEDDDIASNTTAMADSAARGSGCSSSQHESSSHPTFQECLNVSTRSTTYLLRH